jgi:hypothetical protein
MSLYLGLEDLTSGAAGAEDVEVINSLKSGSLN